MLLKNNKSTIFLTQSRDINKTPVLFLHGFSGSSKWSLQEFYKRDGCCKKNNAFC